ERLFVLLPDMSNLSGRPDIVILPPAAIPFSLAHRNWWPRRILLQFLLEVDMDRGDPVLIAVCKKNRQPGDCRINSCAIDVIPVSERTCPDFINMPKVICAESTPLVVVMV